MRITLVINDDILNKAKSIATKFRVPFRHLINEAIKTGLQSIENTPQTRDYRTDPHQMGLIAGRNLDNIHELLSQVEGENHR